MVVDPKAGQQADPKADQKEDPKEGLKADTGEMVTDPGNHWRCTMSYAINAAKIAKYPSNRQAASQYTAVIASKKVTILLQDHAMSQKEGQTALKMTLQKSIRNLIRSCGH